MASSSFRTGYIDDDGSSLIRNGRWIAIIHDPQSDTLLTDDAVNDLTVDIGEAIVATGVSIGELLVIES